MFACMKSRRRSKIGHFEARTRSLCQILKKHCVRSRGHICSLNIMKHGQNVCLDKISDEFENGSCWAKNRSLGQILENLMHALEATFSV